MAITIGSNVPSLTAQRRLSENTKGISRTFERLSSGMRINSASDDAAGLAISLSLRTTSRVLNQAVKNTNDGFSLLNIADGTLESLSHIINRQRELATQSANGSLSAIQRRSIQQESDGLTREYNRIIAGSKFNGIQIFSTASTQTAIQTGEGAENALSLGLGDELALNAGAGTFTTAISVSQSLAYGLAVEDIDLDGYVDAVVTNANGFGTGTHLRILLGNGNGTFRAAGSYATPTDATQVRLADMTGDGNLDIVLSSTTGVCSILTGTGSGSFQAARTLCTQGVAINDLAVADFNNDGKYDVALTTQAGAGNASLKIYLGDGAGNLSQASSLTPTSNSFSSIRLADFNGDGIKDLAAEDSLYVYALLGNGDGTFRIGTTFNTLSFQGYAIATGDFTGDGKDEIVLSRESNYNLRILLNNGAGTALTSGALLSVGTDSTPFMTVGDVDSDGTNELVVTTLFTAGQGGVFEVAANGTITQSTSIAGSRARQHVLADTNNDGILDLIDSSYLDNRVNIFLGDRDSSRRNFSFDGVDLTSIYGARNALQELNALADRIVAERGALGSSYARLQVSLSVLSTARTMYESANSQIMDADIAAESSKLLKDTILQQSASAILGQANQQPALALQLLQI